MDSNHRPSDYDSAALTDWATSRKIRSIFRELINSWGLPQNAKISRWRNLTFQILVSKRVTENCCTHLVVAPSGLEPESPTWKADELNLLFYGAKLVAGVGFEPTTHRLWACWATTALPRDKKFQDAYFLLPRKWWRNWIAVCIFLMTPRRLVPSRRNFTTSGLRPCRFTVQTTGIEPVLSHVTGEHVANYTMPSES